jgi:hypothetical protein
LSNLWISSSRSTPVCFTSAVSGYRRSSALADWHTSRRAKVVELRRAHAVVGTSWPGSRTGRPPMPGTQQLTEALVLRIVTEFQGFVRDLLDLATIRIVRGSGCASTYQAQLVAAVSRDRWIDRGNPHLDAIGKDAARLGIAPLGSQLLSKNPNHSSDARLLKELVGLRNALAHDDQDKLLSLSRRGARPTIRYVNAAYACLGRHARALDLIVWDHLKGLFPGADPWSR